MQESRHKALIGLHPVSLLILYGSIALAPLGLAAALGMPKRALRDELASGLAMVGFAMLLMEFVLSGRLKKVSGRVGIDLTMRFHQLIAWTILAFLLAHPFVYQSRLSVPVDAPGQPGLDLTGMSMVSGGLALGLLAVLVVVAVFRDRCGDSYEGWRLMHGLGAVAVALLGFHHALDAGRYAGHPAMAAYWLGLCAVALGAYGYVHFITPLRQTRHPHRVTSVRRVALKTWEVAVEPVSGHAIEFTAGQFVWLTLGRSPYAVMEHPFSIVSAPAERPRIAFAIKEVGDFTRTVGNTPVGAPAYLDGPHGNFVVEGRSAAGLAFIAGGVGIAPVLSILRQCRAEGDRRPMLLLYGNRVLEQILYPAELDSMRENLDLKIHHVLSEPPAGWSGPVGQLDEECLRYCLDMPDRGHWLYLVCGPTPMIEAVERALERMGVPLRRIVSEKFKYD
jgi:predicted ferric reductase